MDFSLLHSFILLYKLWAILIYYLLKINKSRSLDDLGLNYDGPLICRLFSIANTLKPCMWNHGYKGTTDCFVFYLPLFTKSYLPWKVCLLHEVSFDLPILPPIPLIRWVLAFNWEYKLTYLSFFFKKNYPISYIQRSDIPQSYHFPFSSS